MDEGAPFPLRNRRALLCAAAYHRPGRRCAFRLQAGRADRVERTLRGQIITRQRGGMRRALIALTREEQTRRKRGNGKETDTQGANRYLPARVACQRPFRPRARLRMECARESTPTGNVRHASRRLHENNAPDRPAMTDSVAICATVA
jgi:hypothetical protein